MKIMAGVFKFRQVPMMYTPKVPSLSQLSWALESWAI